jgi:hypothetical protein
VELAGAKIAAGCISAAAIDVWLFSSAALLLFATTGVISFPAAVFEFAAGGGEVFGQPQAAIAQNASSNGCLQLAIFAKRQRIANILLTIVTLSLFDPVRTCWQSGH